MKVTGRYSDREGRNGHHKMLGRGQFLHGQS